eukprot:scaffold35421_cov46-Phaeocystis_antarctica.AAC.2
MPFQPRATASTSYQRPTPPTAPTSRRLPEAHAAYCAHLKARYLVITPLALQPRPATRGPRRLLRPPQGALPSYHPSYIDQLAEAHAAYCAHLKARYLVITPIYRPATRGPRRLLRPPQGVLLVRVRVSSYQANPNPKPNPNPNRLLRPPQGMLRQPQGRVRRWSQGARVHR